MPYTVAAPIFLALIVLAVVAIVCSWRRFKL